MEIEVVGAVIVADGAVLCARRGPGGADAGRWEFPGGKVEPGESPQAALAREIREELGCEVEVGGLVTTTRYDGARATIVLSTYWCLLVAGTPVATEHAELRWLPAAGLGAQDWAPADVPAVELVVAALAG